MASNAKQNPQRRNALPGNWRFPGWSAIFANTWNKRPDAAMFPPKVWGYGWSFNFAYPLIPTKPRWKRVLAFVLGMFFVVLVTWALLSLFLVGLYTIQTLLLPPTPHAAAILA